MWGGATFDIAMRFLHEDPVGAAAPAARGASPTSASRCCFRASNAVGYTNYPDNVVARVRHARRGAGHRHLPHLRFAELAAEHEGGDGGGARDARRLRGRHLLHRRHPRPEARQVLARSTTSSWPRNWSAWARTSSPSRTWPGSASRTPRRSWSRRCSEEIGIPIHFHTHDTSGINAASILKAAEAGVDVADAAIASMSGTTSQPNLNSIVAALRHTPRDTGLDLDALNEFADYWETVRELLRAVRHRARSPAPPRSICTRCPAASTPT